MFAPACKQVLYRRRGAALVLTAVMMVVLVGFAALSVDVGVIINARVDLQRAADAGALAAAEVLGDGVPDGYRLELARAEAQRIVELNPVLGRSVTLDAEADVIFGRANYDPQGNTYDFEATEMRPDAVRVRVRLSEGSPNGPLPLYFAGIFGKTQTRSAARATAAISPRDIAIAADVSGSLLFDSQFSRYEDRVVNLWDVWDHLPGGSDSAVSTWAPHEIPDNPLQSAGPGWGFMKRLAFGGYPSDSGYDHRTDTGLITLAPTSAWNDARLGSYLGELGYSGDEAGVVLGVADEENYVNRVAVALGLAYWNSGQPGGQWTLRNVAPSDTGDGDNRIEYGELEWVEPVFAHDMPTSAQIWRDYVNFSTGGIFQYQYGIKTFLEFTLQNRKGPDETPELAYVPVQPFQAIKGAVRAMMNMLIDMNAHDLVSLESYNTYGVHEVDLTHDFEAIANHLDGMNPDHYGTGTNMSEGIQRAIEELTGPRSRMSSQKVIVILTDGHANRGGGSDGALEAARLARAAGLQMVTVTVGQDADVTLMQQIAEIGQGAHYHSEGSIQEYTEALAGIFGEIGGTRPVELIE